MPQRALTPADKDRYVKSGGDHCPSCDSDDIEGVSSIQAESGCAWQEIRCNACHAEWQDVYQLVDVVPVDAQEPPSQR